MFLGKNNKGMSLLELLIAGAIGSAIILYLGQYIKINESSNQKVMNDMEDTSDNLNMEAVLRKDLTNAKHSLNNLNIQDDKGNKFFDYMSSSTCTSNCARSLKLELGAKAGEYSKKSIYFIINNTGAGEQQIFNPADAYSRNTLTFNSLNYNNNLTLRQNSPWNSSIKERTTLMFIYSPIEVFAPVAGISAPGKILSFMGWAGASNFTGRLVAEPVNDGGASYYDNTDLRTGKKISDEDEFFQTMPYTTGLGSFAFLTSVKIIRYRVLGVTTAGKLSGQLMRGEMNANKTFNETPVGFNIKTVEFSRETISSPAIYIKTDSIR